MPHLRATADGLDLLLTTLESLKKEQSIPELLSKYEAVALDAVRPCERVLDAYPSGENFKQSPGEADHPIQIAGPPQGLVFLPSLQ